MSVVLAAPALGIQIPDTALGENKIPPAMLEAPKALILTVEEHAVAAAEEAGLNPFRFKRLIKCESVWKEDAAGDNGTSFGVLQFKYPTFEMFNKKYNFEERDIMNPYHQIDLAVLMIRDGYISHWKNCGKKVGWIPAVK